MMRNRLASIGTIGSAMARVLRSRRMAPRLLLLCAAARSSCAYSLSGGLQTSGLVRTHACAMSQPNPWWQSLQTSGLAAVASAMLLLQPLAPAFAENELAALTGNTFHSELVRPECFATSCRLATKACAESSDCVKGLACTAKCMGDAECAVGCFARYDNQQLEDVLQCTVEDKGCIQIAIMTPGPDSPTEAPLPPRPLVPATPASLQGRWYKVMGWNSKYDCFDCQRNSFSKPAAAVVSTDIGPKTMEVEVEFRMPREREGEAPSTFRQTLHEKLQFDSTPGSHRTAHTEGRMFGLTFWENWYLIGENSKQEPQFKFVYYTGKTLQNKYEGAFVYARKPELPAAALPHIYKIAREAGMEPTNFCAVDNKCFSAPTRAAQPPLFTPVASADVIDTPAASTTVEKWEPFPRFSQFVRDVKELFEDPRPYGRELTRRQRHMYEIREYDINGFRRPMEEYRSVP